MVSVLYFRTIGFFGFQYVRASARTCAVWYQLKPTRTGRQEKPLASRKRKAPPFAPKVGLFMAAEATPQAVGLAAGAAGGLAGGWGAAWFTCSNRGASSSSTEPEPGTLRSEALSAML